MKKNSKKLIISLIIVSLVALGGGIFFACRKSQKTTEKNNSLPPSHSSPKKTLANQIKADLQKDLEKTEKSDKYSLHKSWEKSLGESCSEYRGNEWRLWYHGETETDSGKEKRKKGDIFPEQLETDDWKEIEGFNSANTHFNQINHYLEKKWTWPIKLSLLHVSHFKITF